MVWLQYFAKPLRCLEQRVESNFICSWYITVCWFVFALGSSLRATGLSGKAVPSLCKLKLERVAPIQGFAVCGLRLKKIKLAGSGNPQSGHSPRAYATQAPLGIQMQSGGWGIQAPVVRYIARSYPQSNLNIALANPSTRTSH